MKAFHGMSSELMKKPTPSSFTERFTKNSNQLFNNNPYIQKGMPKSEPITEQLQVGDQVKHIKFGTGTIMECTPMDNDFSVKVNFEDWGQKILRASMAKLKKV